MKRKKPSFVLVTHELSPESIAMLQALYSRDPQSVVEHLKRVEEVGADTFMGSYYVGYGHKSIGDCGTTTAFVEQVSLLNAKAIQDWQLYNGQEASTRYLNMSKQEVLNPLGTKAGEAIQKEWMAIYEKALAELVPYLKSLFPREESQKESVYEKAIKAKAFDIARGFLPAGVATLLSWHTNLRQAYDHLQELLHHPLPEMRETAEKILTQLKEKYPSSFSHKRYEETENYLELTQDRLAYFDDPKIKRFKSESFLDLKGLRKHKEILAKRPAKAELPRQLKKYGNMRFSFPMDFGSYRDLQRHRACSIEMPLLTTKYGFFPWYLAQLPPKLLAEFKKRIAKQEARIEKLGGDPRTKQYYTAIGYTVTCEVTGNLPALVYLSELRSSQTVHPTFRVVAQQMAKAIKETVPHIAMHYDDSPDTWSIKRGTQDITKK